MSRKTKKTEIHVPKAENIREETERKILINWIDKIEETKRKGGTYCYVCGAYSGGVTKNIVQRFLDAGYDLYYNHFMHNGSWFVKAHWEDGCCGRIYSEDENKCVTIDEMFTY